MTAPAPSRRDRKIVFTATNLIATLSSTGAFALAIATGASPQIATLIRLACSLPVLYAGYSRFLLGGTLIADRRRFGRRPAELRMLGRVGLAIGMQTGLALAIEPLLATVFAQGGGFRAMLLAPLIGGLGYGAAAYLIVRSTPRGFAVAPAA